MTCTKESAETMSSSSLQASDSATDMTQHPLSNENYNESSLSREDLISFSDSSQPHTPCSKPVMASPAVSALASSDRTEVPVLYTSPPSPEEIDRASLEPVHPPSSAPIQASTAAGGDAASPSTSHNDYTHRRPSRVLLPVQRSTMNLKELTCHWWYHTGRCRFSEKDCLYAHHDTGRYADAPRQVVAGQPAVAGRNANRQLREVEKQLTNVRIDDARQMQIYSSSPLADMVNRSFSASPAGAFNIGRSSTPGGLMVRNPAAGTQGQDVFSIVPAAPFHLATSNAAQLEDEVKFFRTLVEQNGREKEILLSTIEKLEAENQHLRAENEAAQTENKRLAEEHESLRGAVVLLQQQMQQHQLQLEFQHGSASNPLSRSSTSLSTLQRAAPGSRSFMDFGTIGARRFASGS